MPKRARYWRILEYGLCFVLLCGALLCMFTPEIFLFKWGVNFTVQIMLGYLLAGVVFFLMNRMNLFLTSFVCCGLLCLHLKDSSSGDLRLALRTEEPRITVGHINLSLAEEYDATLRAITEADVDVWSFQEITPDWYQFLQNALCQDFPYESSFVRIDPYGLAVWSKIPLVHTDTFFFEDIPNLSVSLEPEEERYVHIISTHTTAPVNAGAYQQIRMHFREVGRYITTLEGAVITCGDYNLPSWAPEVKEYKNLAQLKDSRRDISPASTQGNISLFKIPIDHIFYTEEVECTRFSVINDQQSRHLGIIGTYQFKEITL